MLKKTTIVALMTTLIASGPVAIAKEHKEPPAPGSGVAGENVKVHLAETMLTEGLKKLEAKDYKAAYEDINKAAELDKKNLEALYYRAQSLEKLGKTEEAKRDYKAVTLLTPKSADEHFLRGKAFEECGQKEQAKIEFERVKARNAEAKLKNEK